MSSKATEADDARRDSQHKSISRRSLLKALLTFPALGAFAAFPRLQAQGSDFANTRGRGRRSPHVAVVGAGAFGGWTAVHLLRRGARVTLFDAWGPGNSRASSGGDTRVIRGTYGPDRVYVKMVVRSLQLWRENEARWNRKLYRRTGVLWMAGDDDHYEQAALPLLREAGFRFEVLTPAEAGRRYPQVNFDGVKWVIYEQDGGYLLARRACEAGLDGFIAEGGEYRQLSVKPGVIEGGELRGIILSDGSRFSADQYVFACGPWLGKLFPDVIGDLVRPTRQEVFYFGTPAGDRRFSEEGLPVWIDGQRPFYGIPGSERRGFKMADDTRGVTFDPTCGERTPTSEGLKLARDYLEFRFPGLKGAPLLEARVCSYENTPDHHFIIDRHPHAENIWLVGGGSGHGFKHGPAIGEQVAELILEQTSPDPVFALSRFSR